MTTDFATAYNESRNGCNHFVRHPLVRSFQYSDGVQEVAEAGGGCYWLLDILATEVPAAMRKKREQQVAIEVTVKANGKATIKALGSSDAEVWRRSIDWTDMPEGKWVFLLADESERFALVLISEY